jgi:hypothetical protein
MFAHDFSAHSEFEPGQNKKKRDAKLQRTLVAMRTLQMASRAGSTEHSAEPRFQRRPAHRAMKNPGRPP